MNCKSTIKLQAEEHEIIDDANFSSIEEYVLHLMHQSDYEKAQSLVAGKIILDLGCNCGYGTQLLSQTCHFVTGVDVSPMAIETAKRRYQSENLSFQLSDGITLPFDSASFDAITSFQVVEHIADYDIYFSEISRVMKPGGMLLLTTPNAEIRVRPGKTPWNPFHVYEFRCDEFEQLLLRYFSCVTVLGQFATRKAYSIEYNRCIRARDQDENLLRRNLRSKIISYIPLSIEKTLRKLRDRLKTHQPSPLSEHSKNLFSTADFFYRRTDLVDSLSLVAICSSSEVVQDTASHAYLSDK